jgi:hypothetical protein
MDKMRSAKYSFIWDKCGVHEIITYRNVSVVLSMPTCFIMINDAVTYWYPVSILFPEMGTLCWHQNFQHSTI